MVQARDRALPSSSSRSTDSKRAPDQAWACARPTPSARLTELELARAAAPTLETARAPAPTLEMTCAATPAFVMTRAATSAFESARFSHIARAWARWNLIARARERPTWTYSTFSVWMRARQILSCREWGHSLVQISHKKNTAESARKLNLHRWSIYPSTKNWA